MPDWVKHAIWWQVYPLGFTSAEAANERAPVTHRLSQLTGWLDYAVNLGASGIALGPVFAAQTHGYDTTDHYRIDPRLGDEQDFAALAQAAHARGLRLLLDGVFNHVGRLPRLPGAGAGPVPPRRPGSGRPCRRTDAGVRAGVRDVRGTWALVALNHDEPARPLRRGGDESLADAGADGWRWTRPTRCPRRSGRRWCPGCGPAIPRRTWWVR